MASTVYPENSTIPDRFPWDEVLNTEHIFMYMTLSFFSVLGVIGNAIAFYIFFARRNMGTSVTFILALAGTDFVTCLVTIPYTIVFEVLHYRLYYDCLCKMYMFLITSTIPYSSFIMAAIAFDRYFCICHPFLHVLNVQRARMVVLCLALPAFSFGIITGMFYGIFIAGNIIVLNGTQVVGTNLTRADFGYVNESYFIDLRDLEGLEWLGVMREMEYPLGNETHVLQTFQFISECTSNKYASTEFMKWFERIHTSCYLLSFTTVTVLYILIYKFIFERRAMKARRRKKNQYTSVANAETHSLHPNAHLEPDTAMTEFNNTNGSLSHKGGSGGSAGTGSGGETGGGGGRGSVGGGGSGGHGGNTNEAVVVGSSGGSGGGDGVVGGDGNSAVNASTMTTTTTTSTGGGEEEEEGAASTTPGAQGVEAGSPAAGAGGSATGGVKASAALQEARRTSSDASTPLVVHQGSSGSGGGAGKGSCGLYGKGGTKNTNGTTTGSGDNAVNESSRLPKRRGSTTRDRNLYANIKTAMMLFVVALVFLVAFAPACLMVHGIITVQLNVFYLYFVYHVVNPFIYAFMNQSFRDDLKKLLKRS